MLHWLGAEQCRDQKWHFTCDFRNYALPVLPIVVVVNVDHAIAISPSSMDLTMGDEVNRVMQITEDFILWCITCRS